MTDAEFLHRNTMGLKQAKLTIELRRRIKSPAVSAAGRPGIFVPHTSHAIQVFVKTNGDGTARVQFRNKWTCEQWDFTEAACDDLVSHLPEKFTFAELMAAISGHPEAKKVQVPNPLKK